MQEDDVIGILASDNIADLKPLGDRLLVEASDAVLMGALLARAIVHVLSSPILLMHVELTKCMVLLLLLTRLRRARMKPRGACF